MPTKNGNYTHILMGLQSDYDMQTTKNDKSFAARLRNVRKLVVTRY